jgi:hypothetical protein
MTFWSGFDRRFMPRGGGNYQSMTNAALQEYVTQKKEPLEDTLRRVVPEELNRSAS